MPEWWVMPWATIPGKHREPQNACEQETRALKKIGKYFDVYESILKNGYHAEKGGAIKGYFLVHPEYGRIFNYIDGHHRMTILLHLNAKDGRNSTVGVFPLGLITRSELNSTDAFVQGVHRKSF